MLFVAGLSVFSCSSFNSYNYQLENGIKLVDTLATLETVNLYYNLKMLKNSATIFGHHHTSSYGHSWENEGDKSDVKDVTGSFPGIYGWDFSDVVNPWPLKIRTYTRYIKEAYDRGGINVFCWHYDNPVTGGRYFDTTVAVKHILPGGDFNEKYSADLDAVAEFAKNLYGSDGKLIPIIFRPFHEFDGNWFWWGKPFCTKEEFIRLWRYTVNYLRDEKEVRNMIFAFSPDRNFNSEEEYFDRYPGDNYVDILAVDDYGDFQPYGDGPDAVKKKLEIISEFAEKKNKVAAFSETGMESIPDSAWWTQTLLPILNNDSVKVAYVMVWRNASDLPHHYYAPFPGEKSVPDFIKFKSDPKIIFQDNLPNPYIIRKEIVLP